MQTNRTPAALIALALVLSGVVRVAPCQERTDSVMVPVMTPRWTTGSISFQFGSANLGLDEMNSTLSSNGRPAFSPTVVTIGVSGHARFGRLMLGGGGESALPQREVSAGWSNRISFGSAMVDAGFVLVDARRITIYPQLSLGVRATSLKVQQVGDFTYEDGVRDPARGVEMSSISALAGIGIVAETHLATQRLGSFSVGVRAGLVTPLGAPGTLSGESMVSGAPREEQGWHLRLIIGRPIAKRSDVVRSLSTAVLSILTR